MGPDILTTGETGGKNSGLRFSYGFPEVCDIGDEDKKRMCLRGTMLGLITI